MVRKTITVTEHAYRLLKQHKRPGESFSQVIQRTFGGGSARALVGLMDPEEAEEIRADLQKRRKRRVDHARKRAGKTIRKKPPA